MDYDKMLKSELQELATSRGIEFTTKDTKANLIDMLNEE